MSNYQPPTAGVTPNGEGSNTGQVYERDPNPKPPQVENYERGPAEKALRIILGINRALWITTIVGIFTLFWKLLVLLLPTGIVTSILQTVFLIWFAKTVKEPNLAQAKLRRRANIGTTIAWFISVLALVIGGGFVLPAFISMFREV